MPKPELPDQFLYSRTGPWPQPSPSHPLKCANEVLNIPAMETLLFNNTIGARYLDARLNFPPIAAAYVVQNLGWAGPVDTRFEQIMYTTLYTRFLKPLSPLDQRRCKENNIPIDARTKKYDFTAMNLLDPLEGMYCAATVLIISEDPRGKRSSACIFVNDVCVKPSDSAWSLAKIYALQGAAYHVLFVVHPALHFPMDSVNAITKSAVPIAHPLFQLLAPHSRYQLALDNAVLESAESVVNNNAQGTRFDPLTANAYNLKLLFGAGYTGLPADKYDPNAYPRYDYMQPVMGFDSDYGAWLKAYYAPFQGFCSTVAVALLEDSRLRQYVIPWARYNHAHVLGFPDEKQILDADVLANALAIFMWNGSVAHGGDHASFGETIEVTEKCLRIRRPPPKSPNEPPVAPGEIFSEDDLARAAICQDMFFQPWAIPPNLGQTSYALTDPKLFAASQEFNKALIAVSKRTDIVQFMPLGAHVDPKDPAYASTIPQSIQY